MVLKFFERKYEKRREELAGQYQSIREEALKSSEDEGYEGELSGEDRVRLELIRNVITLAREHPDHVTRFIRTWLRE